MRNPLNNVDVRNVIKLKIFNNMNHEADREDWDNMVEKEYNYFLYRLWHKIRFYVGDRQTISKIYELFVSKNNTKECFCLPNDRIPIFCLFLTRFRPIRLDVLIATLYVMLI